MTERAGRRLTPASQLAQALRKVWALRILHDLTCKRRDTGECTCRVKAALIVTGHALDRFRASKGEKG